jgi:TonB-dependent SusC/RagA subfamily outer membrane receptor
MNVLLLAVLAPAVALQAPDSSTSDRPDPDRIVLDAATIAHDGAARRISEVLTSRVPALLVIPGSGLNGSGASIRFAGVRSLVADLPPLILLDGFRIDAGEEDSQLFLGGPGPSRLDDIPLADVQSIEVLRGPANTAIYGPGAAAGVILIHTKEARGGSARIEGFVEGTVRTVPTRWPTNYGGVDLDNTLTALQQGGCSLSIQAAGYCVQDFVRSFNPLADRNPFATAPQRQLGLSATAGPSWGAFRISGVASGDAAAYAVPAVTWNDDSRHWNVRGSATIHAIRNVDILASVAQMSSTLRLPMYQPVRSALLGTSDSTAFTWGPYFQAHGSQDVDRTQLGISVRARPFPWLGMQARFGRDDARLHESSRVIGQSRTAARRRGANQTVAFNATAANLSWGRLRFTTTLAIERLTNRNEAWLEQIEPDTITSCGIGSPACLFFARRTARSENAWGVYGVEQIGIGSRVFVTGALRHDAFDDFDAWSGTHPSLALDWVARSRPDLPGALEQLTFRAAYGTADLPLPATIPAFFAAPIYVPEPLEPETTREIELSAAATGLAGKWRAQVSVYDLRSEVIQSVLVPTPGPLVTAYVPGARMSNRGVAATVAVNLIDRQFWTWDVGLSLWGNRNRLVKTVSPAAFYSDGLAFAAQGEFEGYPANGYWSNPIVGFSDADGDGIIAANEVALLGTYAWAGSPYPTQGAAVTSSWRFNRRVRLSATLDYRAGQTLFNETENLRCRAARCRGRIDRTAPLAEQANALAAFQLPLAYFEDADYLKLRELTLSFDVPERMAAALGARTATIMIGGRDLVTWSKYSGADPEAGSYGRHNGASPTIVGDFATVPIPASWMLRVRVAY